MGNPDPHGGTSETASCAGKTVSFDAGKLRTGLEVIANHLGKKLDEDNPVLHAQLPDGSRLAAVIPPVVRPAPALTIRKFSSRHYTVEDLISRGTLTRPLAAFLAEQIAAGKTLLISGGTGTREDDTSTDSCERHSRSTADRRYRRYRRASHPEAEHSFRRMSDRTFKSRSLLMTY